VRGSLLHTNRVKLVDPGSPPLAYGPGTGFRFAVQPGQELIVSLEELGSHLELMIGADAPTAPEFSVAFDLKELEGVRRIARDGGGWRVETVDTPTEDGISLWWHLRSPGFGDDPAALDEALRRQLEALGYVD
jgi:hypothetical protein